MGVFGNMGKTSSSRSQTESNTDNRRSDERVVADNGAVVTRTSNATSVRGNMTVTNRGLGGDELGGIFANFGSNLGTSLARGRSGSEDAMAMAAALRPDAPASPIKPWMLAAGAAVALVAVYLIARRA